jgi:tetrahydromethanopterin S-methyltransferase subunit C
MSSPARALIGVAGLPLVAVLFALQAVYDSLALWAASIVAAFAVFVVGVVTAVLALRSAVPSADAGRLDELDALPHRDQDGR